MSQFSYSIPGGPKKELNHLSVTYVTVPELELGI
jgi:hypothetical protein